MSTLYISIYSHQAHEGNGRAVGAPQEPGVDDWALAIEDTSHQTGAFPSYAKYIMLVATAPCHYAIGPNPTAHRGLRPLFAGERVFFGVHPDHKLAVIAA